MGTQLKEDLAYVPIGEITDTAFGEVTDVAPEDLKEACAGTSTYREC